jgi:DNA repair photolyase
MIYEPKGEAAEYAYLAINHYTGCTGGCDYPCYMRQMFEQKKVQPAFDQPRVKKDAWKHIKSVEKHAGTKKRVQLCFSTDPYQPFDDKIALTRAVIVGLKAHNIPMQILTKFGTRACRDFELYGKRDLFGSTIVSTDEGWISEHEPKAACYSDRCAALIRAKAAGIATWVSLEPVIDPGEALKVIRYTHSFVDHYKIGKLNHASSNVDWKDFAHRAVDECHKVGALYYLKASLAACLEPHEYENTDWRMIG